MHEHHDRMRPIAFGLDDPAVHLLSLVVRVAPIVERPAGRRRLAEDPDRLVATVVQDPSSVDTVGVPEPDRPVGTNARVGDGAGRCLDPRGGRRGDVVAEEFVATVVRVAEQQRRRVRPPIQGGHVPWERALEVRPRPRREVPNRRPLAVLLVADHCEAMVPVDRRPGRPEHAPRAIAAVRDRAARPGVDDPERGMQQVAVLRVLQREQRAVRRETGSITGVVPVAGDPEPLGAPRDLLRRTTIDRYEDREAAVAICDRDGGDPRPERHPVVPSDRQAFEERLGAAPFERLPQPPPGLITRVFLPEQDLIAVEARAALRHADGVVGDLPTLVRRDVPAVDLPYAGLVRCEDGPVGGAPGPMREVHLRSSEPTLPQRHVGHRDRLPGTGPTTSADEGWPRRERRGHPRPHLVLIGFGGSGVRFGLQATPGSNTCGSWRPSFTS